MLNFTTLNCVTTIPCLKHEIKNNEYEEKINIMW